MRRGRLEGGMWGFGGRCRFGGKECVRFSGLWSITIRWTLTEINISIEVPFPPSSSTVHLKSSPVQYLGCLQSELTVFILVTPTACC